MQYPYYKLPKAGNNCFLAAVLAIISTYSSVTFANEQQTLILSGSELLACSSMSIKTCQDDKQIEGKRSNLYRITDTALTKIESSWPSDNLEHRDKTVKLLDKVAQQHADETSKSDLLWAWRDLDPELLNNLTEQEYNFIVDVLEVAVIDSKGKRIKETINTQLNTQAATNDILNFVHASAKVNAQKPTLLTITAASRDPYASADKSEALYNFTDVQTQWLALTPALAKAITTEQCNQLAQIRTQSQKLYNRQTIYPDRIKAEQALCDKGIDALVETINLATAVTFNDGSIELLHRVLFDDNGQPYPWTSAIQSRPLLIGSGAGAVIQSAGKIKAGKKLAMSGLGSFKGAVLETHFSEQNRLSRLTSVLEKTGQQYGLGIDEATSLVSINSPEAKLLTVIGKNGVSYINNTGEQGAFTYSYWPSSTVVDVTSEGYNLSQRTLNSTLAKIQIPKLPMQRFMDIFTDSKFRSLTQALCLTGEKQAAAQQDELSIAVSGDEQTNYYRVNSSSNGCLVDKVGVKINTIQ